MAEVLIIGGGVAGSTCALFLGRANIETVVVDVERSSIRQAQLNNMPGRGSTSGMDWLAEVRLQASELPGIRYQEDRVKVITSDSDGFAIDLESGAANRARFVVLATGSGSFRIEGLGLEVLEPVQPFIKSRIAVNANYETERENVFACGVLAGVPSQTVVCAGTGAHVAIEIVSRVQGAPWVDHDKPVITSDAG